MTTEWVHQHARDHHETRQRVMALRHAAVVLTRDDNLPSGDTQRETIAGLSKWLRRQARQLEGGME